MRSNVRNETVKNFDPERYIGTWYEIGKYPNVWFESDCSYAVAEYSLNADGSINIKNSCMDSRGRSKRISEGRGRIVDSGKLKVMFKSTPEQPAMPFEGDYWLHYTDYNKFAIVGEPTGNMYGYCPELLKFQLEMQ